MHTERMSDHFTKHHLNREGQMPWRCRPVIHHFTSPDPWCFHDHPFGQWSSVLDGGYVEEVATISADGTWSVEVVERLPQTTFYIGAHHIHRIVGLPDGECLTASVYGEWEQHVSLFDARPDGVWRCPADGRWDWQPAMPQTQGTC